MEGMFIGDEETPPECLRRYLADASEKEGLDPEYRRPGLFPEQYYHSLLAFVDRFRPHFVIVSVFTNDFGDIYEVATKGRGDWAEGKYWLDQIAAFCRSREWPHLVVPVPFEPHMLGNRRAGYYPGTLSNILEVNSTLFVDPTDDFINAYLALVVEGERKGQRPMGCPLFNVQIGDGHFSAIGSEAWAAAVGRRLVLLLEKDRLARAGEGLQSLSSGWGLRLEPRGNSRFEIRDSRFGIRDSGFGIRDSGFGIRDSGFEIRDSRFEIRDSRFEIRDSRFKTRDARCEKPE